MISRRSADGRTAAVRWGFLPPTDRWIFPAGVCLLLGFVVAVAPGMTLAATVLLGGAVLLVVRPDFVLAGLLYLYAAYMWLVAMVLPAISPSLPGAVGVGKDLVLIALFTLAVTFRWSRIEDQTDVLLRGSFIAFVGLAVALAFVGAAPLRVGILEARFHVNYILLLPIGLALGASPSSREMLVRAVCVAGAGLAIAWLSALGWASLNELQYSGATLRALLGESGGGDPINGLGLHLAVLVCLVVGVAQHDRVRNRLLIWYPLAALMTWGLLATFSRRSLLGLVLGIMVVAVMSRRWRLLSAGVVAAAVVLITASGDLVRRVSFSTLDETRGLSLRLEHLRHTVQSIDPLTFWIGHGMGTSGVVPVEAGVRGAVDIHNYYLLLFYEGGVILLLLYLFVALGALLLLARRYRSVADTWSERGVVLGTASAFFAFLAAGMYGVSNATLPIAPIMWTLVGLALAVPMRLSLRMDGEVRVP